MKKNIIIIILLFLSSVVVSGQEENADAVYQKLIKEYRLHPDGSWDFHLEKELKLLTHFSFHRLYGETFIVYNPDYQKLQIDHAYTIMRNGKKVITPENAFNEVLPRGAANAPAYNQLREMVVTHTGLETGAVIHLGYTLKNSADFYPVFMGEEMIGESSPVNEMEIRVIIPEGKSLQHQTSNIRTAPEISTVGMNKVYTWKFVNLKANTHESYKDKNLLPRILFSESDNLHKTYDKFIRQEAFYFKTDRSMSEKAKVIRDKSNHELKTMMGIQDMVIHEIREYHLTLPVTAFRVRPPMEVWESSGGTKLEKACLLASLLREANISARVVAVIPDKYYLRELGNLLVMDDFLVQVNPREHGQFYISATGNDKQNLYDRLAGNQLLVLESAIESLRTFETKQSTNKIQFGTGLVIQEDQKIVGTCEIELENFANPYLKILNDSNYIYSLISGFGKSEIKEFEFLRLSEDKSSIHYEVENKNAFKENEEYLFMQLPEPRNHLNEAYLSTLAVERRDALKLENPLHYSYSYSVSVPDQFEMVSKPLDLKLENQAGKLEIKFEKSGQNILIEKSLEIPDNIIKPNVYQDFRKLMMEWYDGHYGKLVLKKN